MLERKNFGHLRLKLHINNNYFLQIHIQLQCMQLKIEFLFDFVFKWFLDL